MTRFKRPKSKKVKASVSNFESLPNPGRARLDDLLSSDLALGRILTLCRQKRKMTPESLARKLKISARRLRALEADEWGKLPAPVYVRGYIKKYAQILGIDDKGILDRYERELQKIAPVSFSGKGPKTSQPLRFTHTKTLAFIVTLSFFLIAGFYILWQISHAVSAPELSIAGPPDDFITDQPKIMVAGTTEGDVSLTINGERVYPDENGRFLQEILLAAGLNLVEIKAVNSFGKSTVVLKKVLYASQK